MFILHELYQQQREVVDHLTTGAKVLSFNSRPLKFIDSLCFLPMPLAPFPSKFNLTELKKGFFLHLFNTPDNQQYVGRIPDLEFYDPDGMMTKKKEELLSWHSDQVRRNVSFNFRLEMIDYCKSDVGTSMVKTPVELVDGTYEGIIPVDEIRRDSSPDVLFTAIADVLNPVRTGTLLGNLLFLIIEPLQGLD